MGYPSKSLMPFTKFILVLSILCFIVQSDSDDNQTSCQTKCEQMSYYSCTICYTKCSGQNASFQMNSCQEHYCADYTDNRDHVEDMTHDLSVSTHVQGNVADTQTIKPSQLILSSSANQHNEEVTQIVLIIVGVIAGLICLCVIVCLVYNMCNPNCLASQENLTPDNVGNQTPQFSGENFYQNNNFDKENESGLGMKRQLPIQLPIRENFQNQNNMNFNLQPMRQSVNWNDKSQFSIEDQQNYGKDIACAICLSQGTNCITDCRHHFHMHCIVQWLKQNPTCPMCISQNFNPVTVFCMRCNQRQMKCCLNQNTQITGFVNSNGQILCDYCLSKNFGQINQAKLNIDFDQLQE